MEKATIPLIAFTSDTVARLTGLSVRQLHYWDRQGFFRPSLADPNRRRPHSRVYSFNDVVGLRTIAQLLDQGATWPNLKNVRAFFASSTNADWANRSFSVVDGKVYFSHRDAIVASRPLGQSVSPVIVELAPIVRQVQQAVAALPVRGADQIGKVTRDRLIMNGQDILAGTRIPTATIDWHHRHGASVDEMLEDFPRLTRADIDAAIRHEEQKRALDAERVAAAS